MEYIDVTQNTSCLVAHLAEVWHMDRQPFKITKDISGVVIMPANTIDHSHKFVMTSVQLVQLSFSSSIHNWVTVVNCVQCCRHLCLQHCMLMITLCDAMPIYENCRHASLCWYGHWNLVNCPILCRRVLLSCTQLISAGWTVIASVSYRSVPQTYLGWLVSWCCRTSITIRQRSSPDPAI